MMSPSDLTRSQQRDLLTDFADHGTFCRESLSIRDPGGSKVALELGAGQIKLHGAAQKQRLAGKPVRLVILKTRRSWFTAGNCAEMFHEIPFLPGRQGLIIADHYDPAALEAFGYLTQFQESYRPFTRHGASIRLPKLVKNSEQEIAWENESKIDVYSADRGGGDVGRGGGRHWLLGDEAAFWAHAEVTLTSILNMVPDLAETDIRIQSTANGKSGEFYELCMKAMDPANTSGWDFVFFGWLEHAPYRMAVENPAKLQASLDYEERLLMDMHGASLEQLAWRRWKIATACRGKVDIFHQEYPTTPEEAFLASGRPALDHKALARMPVSPGLPGELREVEAYPKNKILFLPGEHGALSVWRRPEPGRLYVIGADPSRGEDVSEAKRGDNPDWSVGWVADLDTGEQVALLRERLRPGPFAEYLTLLARWYNMAFLTPESNDAGFIDAILKLKYPLSLIYNAQRDPTDRRTARVQEIGFETTASSRPWLIGALDDAVREMSITIRSPVALQECYSFVIKPNGKAEHQVGCHDDCVIAGALSEMGRRVAPRRRPNLTGAHDEKPRGYGVFAGDRRKREDDDE